LVCLFFFVVNLFIYFRDDVLRINLFMKLALQSMVSDNYTLLLVASKL